MAKGTEDLSANKSPPFAKETFALQHIYGQALCDGKPTRGVIPSRHLSAVAALTTVATNDCWSIPTLERYHKAGCKP